MTSQLQICTQSKCIQYRATEVIKLMMLLPRCLLDSSTAAAWVHRAQHTSSCKRTYPKPKVKSPLEHGLASWQWHKIQLPTQHKLQT